MPKLLRVLEGAFLGDLNPNAEAEDRLAVSGTESGPDSVSSIA